MQKQLLELAALNAKQLTQVRELVDLSAVHDGFAIKLYWNIISQRQFSDPSDFLYYLNGKLVGYLGTFVFKEHEAEITAVIHPAYRKQAVFSGLLQRASAELHNRYIFQSQFICHRAATIASYLLQQRGARYDHSEYEMQLRQLPTVVDVPAIQLKRAQLSDLPLIVKIDVASFNSNPQMKHALFTEHMKLESRKIWLVTAQDTVVGKIHVRLDGKKAFIHEAGILPEFRRKRYAAAMVLQLLVELKAEGFEDVSLEVLGDNEAALELYKKCGFVVANQYDFWRMRI